MLYWMNLLSEAYLVIVWQSGAMSPEKTITKENKNPVYEAQLAIRLILV